MKNWQFVESPGGGWYWVCTDVISRKMRSSATTFKSRTECMADAMWYGYQQTALPSGRQAKSKHMPARGARKKAPR